MGKRKGKKGGGKKERKKKQRSIKLIIIPLRVYSQVACVRNLGDASEEGKLIK